MTAFCRDCLKDMHLAEARCKTCGSRRIIAHEELDQLSIAHLDCDAFYAAVEKRDNPDLRDKPVLIGGMGSRSVVSTACYIARIYGAKSAMPMFKALELCPQAVVVRPDFKKYTEASKSMRAMMAELSPLVEPLSLDEAYLDLGGTERLHGISPAKSLARLAKRVEHEIGITVSVGLSHNKFLAKLASDLDKPRGFSVIGKAEAVEFLREKPVALMRGAGAVLQARLAKDGITRIGQIQDMDMRDLSKRYGNTGLWLHRLSHGQDRRLVEPNGEMKSISSETTFEHDVSDYTVLERALWQLAEKISQRAKAADLGGRTVVLKLKTKNFRLRTRNISLEFPTQLADRIFRVAQLSLRRECDGTPFRLLGIGIMQLAPTGECDPPDLVDQKGGKRAKVEQAMDKVRNKFGITAVGKGRGLK